MSGAVRIARSELKKDMPVPSAAIGSQIGRVQLATFAMRKGTI
jgi:hypothetical protein